ncbi:MAG: hypothetical protein AAF618_07460 [Pseudomonadota bacterium]
MKTGLLAAAATVLTFAFAPSVDAHHHKKIVKKHYVYSYHRPRVYYQKVIVVNAHGQYLYSKYIKRSHAPKKRVIYIRH